jgi:hypothetical protein
MTNEDFQIACLFLKDQQKLIAAGKVQRWDVVKWTMAINLALATASISIGKVAWAFFVFSLLVAAAGGYLLYHYNKRMTGARSDAGKFTSYLREGGVDLKLVPIPKPIQGLSGEDRTPSMHDSEEIHIFGYIIGCSILPSFLAWAVVGL